MALVTTDWVLQNLNNPKVRVVEVDYDPNTAYNQWHVPGAVLIEGVYIDFAQLSLRGPWGS